ncbi:MAG: nucleotidyltransferase domain-containing protein [Nanoarchaeota archaeon]|nr:nucleotidyltransferase domain-containing protein [Nanoarchaeota archaeon]
MRLENVAEVRKWGNSGGVLLPREWLGKQVKVILIDRTLEIKKEVLRILEPYLEDIIGIYLVGSYARGEQRKDSDIDVLAISEETKKLIKSGKYEIEIIPLRIIIKTLEIYPAMIYPKLIDAKPILNKSLLDEIQEIKLSRGSMKRYLDDCKRIIKINREFVEEDKLEGNILEYDTVIYSSILRLRSLYMMKCIFMDEKYLNKKFKRWLISELEIGDGEYKKIYEAYRAVRDDRKSKEKISVELGEKLVNLLEKEVKEYKIGKKKKET